MRITYKGRDRWSDNGRSSRYPHAVWAMPPARAFVLRMASLFGAATLRASIPIAALTALYFAAQLVRGAL
jgi:hypothetical protein